MASAGADPALVQDALFDAEEHLQAEMAVGEVVDVGTAAYETRFAAVAEGYGTPEEVAAAYLGTAPAHAAAAAVAPTPPHAPAQPYAPPPAGVQAGMAAAAGTGTPPSVLAQIFGVFADPAVYKALAYMILSLGTGIAYFTIVVTGVSTFVPLLIMIIGVPLFLLFLGAVRGIALFEGRLVEWLLGTRMPRRPRAVPPNSGIVERIWFWVKDSRTWASMAYMLLMLPLGIAYFTIAVTGLATGIGLLASPLWAWTGVVGEHAFTYEGVNYDWWSPAWGIPLAMLVGAALLVGMMHVIKWIGRGHAAFAKALLVRLAK
jgi:hypothetical protein